MNKYLIASFLVLTITNNIWAQKVESVNFDSENGEYVINYLNENGDQHQAFYVPGNQVKPFVYVSVSLDSAGDLFSYSYEVINEKDAISGLYSFSVEIKAPIENAKNPNNSWFSGMYPRLSVYDWAHTGGEEVGIQPSENQKGFFFQSLGLPAIVKGYASSVTGVFFSEEQEREELPYEVDVVVDSLKRITEHVTFQTIGPKVLPENISNTALVDTLQSYLSFSCDTTWIKNQGICRSLETKLENVDRQLQRENTSPARGSLQAFLNEVEALREKQLSSEAYALLWFNGQYLLERL